jgi:hypothetical protein
MFLTVNSTAGFERDLKILARSEQKLVLRRVQEYRDMIMSSGGRIPRAGLYRPHAIRLKNGFTSSLSVLRAQADIQIILTVDEDPLFNQIIITVLRAVRSKDLKSAFDSVARSLYQNQISE